jgi:nickel superoxide dismutase
MKAFAILVCSFCVPAFLFGHCEIPCGIFDDEARLHLLAEHIVTIEKSMNEINRLSREEKANYSQIVRWVMNKEHHADEIREVATQYFMAQRVRPVADPSSPDYRDYIEQLTTLHSMIVNAMKSKQTTDLQYTAKLREDLASFRGVYWHAKVKSAFLHVYGAFHAKDIDRFWDSLGQENRKARTKAAFAELMQKAEMKKDYDMIANRFREAREAIEKGARFEVHGQHAHLEYSNGTSLEMVSENGGWLLGDFE